MIRFPAVWIAAWMTLTAHCPDTAAARPTDGARPVRPAWGLIILEAEAFSCLPCLDRQMGVIRSLPADLFRANVWIVVLDDPCSETDEALRRDTVGRRAEAVLKACRLDRPVIIDRSSRWRALAASFPALILFDAATRSARTFPLPLSPDGREAVRNILKEGVPSHDIPGLV